MTATQYRNRTHYQSVLVRETAHGVQQKHSTTFVKCRSLSTVLNVKDVKERTHESCAVFVVMLN